MDSIEQSNGNITVVVDYRTELLGILMYISDYHKLYPINNQTLSNKDYIEKIINNFSKYKDDDVVKKFEYLYHTHPYFSYDSPMNLFLQLDSNFSCTNVNDYIYKQILKSDDKVYDFIDDLNSFAERINFFEYYNSNKENYKKYVNSVLECFDNIDLKQYVNDYFGYDNNKKFYVNLLPFASMGGYNVTLDNEIYSNIAVSDDGNYENIFDIKNKNGFVLINLHEICHGYVDDITDNQKLITEDTDLFNDIKNTMKNYGYPTDKEILNEHIIRAIELKTIENVFGDNEWYKYMVNEEKKLGFIYIDVVVEALDEYEKSREIYPTFNLFYPVIIDSIKNYKKINKQK